MTDEIQETIKYVVNIILTAKTEDYLANLNSTTVCYVHWWLWYELCLFHAFNRITHNSLYVANKQKIKADLKLN